MHLTKSLLNWYSQNKRPLPWRETRDPYKIWLSEVILQQTRVAQGMDYYHRFILAFPDVQSLAAATEQDVLKLWQGLGYYSRARNMHHTANEVVERYNGVFPKTSEGLKKLKGIGEYTAAAIASICYDEPSAVLDGNVARVLSRLFAINTPVDTSTGRSVITNLASNLLGVNHPGTFNQAVMELGALVCTPKSPACNACPLTFACEALKRKQVESFPVKTPKKPPALRYMNYLVISFMQDNEEFVVMRKRTGNDIWKNLYDFPCIESGRNLNPDEVIEIAIGQNLFSAMPFTVKAISTVYVHQLSHRRLLARFIQVQLHGKPLEDSLTLFTRKKELGNLPIPRLIDRFLVSELL